MTTAFASIVVLRLCLLMGLFSPVFMMRGGDKAATRKRKIATTKRAKKARPAKIAKPKKVKPAKAKKAKPIVYSAAELSEITRWRIGRDFPTWNPGGQMPE